MKAPDARQLVIPLLVLLWLAGCAARPNAPRPLTGTLPTTLPGTQPAVLAPASLPPPPTPSALPLPSATPAPTLVATPTAAASALPPPLPTPAAANVPDAAGLAAYMLDLINRDRAAAGLNPVAWDETMALAGQLHSEDMLARDYFNHVNPDGLGPDVRYSLLGGQHVVRENLHTFRYAFEDGSGAPIDNWEERIAAAQEGLMNSPGHRANILEPSHTHVGIGMAYNPATGRFTLAQEFGNHYAILSAPLPQEIAAGDSVRLAGTIGGATVDNVLFNLAYEPLPTPLPAEALAAGGAYGSAAQAYETWRGSTSFDETLTIDGQFGPGIYHLRIFADIDGAQALLVDHALWLR